MKETKRVGLENGGPPIVEIGSEVLYKDRFVTVTLAEVKASWGEGKYCHITTRDSAAAIIVTEDNKIVLVKQYRYPAGTWGYEIPQGLANPEDEDINATLKREVKEETGLVAKSVKKISTFYPEPDRNTSGIEIFLVEAEGVLGAGGDALGVELIDLGDIPLLIEKGEITEGASLFGVMYAQVLALTNGGFSGGV